MKLRYIALALTIGCLCSCSSSKKAQTTTDDVYYSDGSQQDGSAQSGNGYVANDGSDDRVQPNNTADNYNQYAYSDGYSPYSTYIDPYWGMGFGMSPFYNPYGFYQPYGYYGFGYGFGFSRWSTFYGSPYPAYYGGYYNPYYPGFGYYSHPYVTTTSLYTGGATRVGVLAYNTNHFNNVNTTVPTMGGISHPVTNTVSGRVPVSLNNNKVTASNWQPYNGQSRATTVSRQSNTNVRTNNANTRTYQPMYRPASSSSSFGRSGGFGGGGRMGGGGRGH